MIKKVFVAVLFLSSFGYSQNTDSLYKAIVKLTSGQSSQNEIQGNVQNEKCAFALFAEVKQNFDKFTPKQQNVLTSILNRPNTDTSIVSPSGFFRIHYSFNKFDKPGYSIQDLAVAFDSSYNFEVNFLGYPPPPPDGNEGGDDKYDVYVIDLSGGLYGYTEPATQITNFTSSSFIVMDNDYQNYYSSGFNGAKVTAAHEFHHAIQIGNYIFRDADRWYYELTSTSMEEFVFDDVNDYYAYIPSFFNSPFKTISSHTGYDMALWNIYLHERFFQENPMLGYNIIKRSWELMVHNRATVAIAKAVQEKGHSFKFEYANFGEWIYFTNYRAKTNSYFEEAKNYPLIHPTTTIEFVPPKKQLSITSEPVSFNYIIFPDFSHNFTDTLVTIISNSDVEGATDPGNNILNLNYTISSNQFENSNKINEFYFSKISSDKSVYLTELDIFNNQPTGQTVKREEIDYAYPQPFDYSNGTFIYFPTSLNTNGEADLNIYTSSMKLIYSAKKKIFVTDKIVVQWNAKDFNGAKLPTGVYIYVTKSADNVKKGKFIIYNK